MTILSRDTIETIGTSAKEVSQQMSPPFRQRISIILTNVSTAGQVISIATGQEAKSGQGIVLYAGGYWKADLGQGFITQQQITGISSAVDGKLAIHEEISNQGAY